MKRVVLGLFIAWWGCMSGVSLCAALPEVTLRNMDGREVKVAALAQTGKPVIISFFATWCKPCMRELKNLNELYADWQEETGVEIYIVSIDQGQDIRKVQPLVEGNGWDFHVLLDPNSELKRAMNVQNVPHLFVLDSSGKIVFNHQGYNEGMEDEVRKLLK